MQVHTALGIDLKFIFPSLLVVLSWRDFLPLVARGTRCAREGGFRCAALLWMWLPKPAPRIYQAEATRLRVR